MPLGPDPVYRAAFYDPFQPQIALEMLERAPGFALIEGTLLRGFGGRTGNVLVDGRRPTVKSGGIAKVLRCISAARTVSLMGEGRTRLVDSELVGGFPNWNGAKAQCRLR